MTTFDLYKGTVDIRLNRLFYQILHKYQDEFKSLNSILENNGVYLSIISYNADVFKDIKKDFPNLRIVNKFNDPTQLTEHNMLWVLIYPPKDDNYKLTNNTYSEIYNRYIDKVDDIYRIDNTGFIVLSDDINIVSDILNEISELFNYTYIGNRHIFTLKD